VSLQHPLAQEKLPAEVRAVTEKAKLILNRRGWREVEMIYFFEPAEGCMTELDDLPANVFECLFAEVI